VDRIGHERQSATTQCIANQLGCDVEDPIAEPVAGSSGSVVRLVGMEDVQLARKAYMARAAVAKGLNAGGRDPYRVRVVAMELICARVQLHLSALDAVRGGPKPDRVRTWLAGSFKTLSVDAS